MSLFIERTGSSSRSFDLLARIRRLRREHLQRKAAHRSLQRLLDRGDDFLLEDVGIDRETAHRLIGETLVVPHRAWDRWQ
ncbi:hypothetical protein ASG43_16670 [Aureimonas sp. Leaf454]|uniref:hypothetical protein n=1 Tax=Aureimonas sp. Leaf454 TaxID=1736381 RepID=UPI0006F90D9F|nr:hypothetical protein [Aureimonas sp. Leaf454]KQT43138.1 hypothetical protein ASG43_16670 [Aureimonas sp. Leaf454]